MRFTFSTNAFLKMLPLSILMFWASFISAQVYPQTSLVKDLQVGSVNSAPRYFATLGNKTFFLANTESDVNQPPRLMVTDGNDASVSSLVSTTFTGISAPVIYNGQLYFGLQQSNSITLWHSADGVSASLVDTVWKGSEYVRFYEDYVFVKNNELFIKVSRNLSPYNADSVMDLFKSSGQSNGLVNLGLVETKYSNAESTSSEIFRGDNVNYFLTNFSAFSNVYVGVRVSVGNNAPVINYAWSALQQPTASMTALGVLNNNFIFLNKDTLTRLNAQGQKEALLTGVQYGSKIAQVNNFIYFNNSGKGIYRTDGTVAGTILISDNNSPISDTKPLLSDDISVIGDTLYLCGSNYSDKFGIWQINSASTVFKRILNIEAPKPFLKSLIINNKLYLTETIGGKATLYEPDFATNKVKIIGQIDRLDYPDTKAKRTYSVLNNNLILAAGDDDATVVTANAKGLELRRLSLTPSVLTYPCIADTVKPKWYSCPTDFVISQPEGFCIGTVLERPNAYDNCNVPITGVFTIRGSFIPENQWVDGKPSYNLCPYDIYDTITYSARDLAYNVEKCSFTAIARRPNPCNSDISAPIFVNCPKDTVINSNQSIIVNWTSPAVTDNCGIPSLSVNYAVGSRFPVGVTNVIYTAKDAKNNTSTCSFKITINASTNLCDTDKIKPIFQSCPNNIVLTTLGTTAIATWAAPIATDNCGTPSVSAPNYASGTAFPIGTSLVYYTALDSKNNAASCIFEVTVSKVPTGNDVCADPSANIKGGSNAINITGITTGSAIIQVFNSNWTTVFQQQVSANSFTVPNMAAGVYNVKITVLGAGGKWPSVCSNLVNNVTVTSGANPCDTDSQAPILNNCPQNISLNTTSTTAIATWAAPTATDNCTATPSVSSNYTSGFAFPIGTTTVTYTAKDVKNNTATCSFNVTVTVLNNCTPIPPTKVSVTNYTSNTAVLKWLKTANAVEYEWSFRNDDTTQPDGGSVISTGITADTFTTLNVSTGRLRALVRSRCVANGTWSAWSEPVFFYNLPSLCTTGARTSFNENFENTGIYNTASTDLPNCWRRLVYHAPTVFEAYADVRATSRGTLGNDSKRVIMFRTHLTDSATIIMVTPELSNMATGTQRLRFKAANTWVASETGSALIQIGTMSSNEDISTFKPFGNLTTILDNTFREYSIDFSTYRGSDRYIAFKYVKSSGDYYKSLEIDDVIWEATPTLCDADTQAPILNNCPQNISLNATGTTAIATWTAPTATDNCTATPSVSSNYTSGFAFPIGTTTVTYTAKDVKNNTMTCSFNVTISQSLNNSCRYNDSLSLVDLYNNTDGVRWNTNWDLSKPLDTWYGIKLTEEGCVKSIILPSNNLNGQLPNLNYKALDTLFLHINKISGTLPLINCPNLITATFSYNYLNGDIPELSLLNLQQLALNNNSFSGQIPNINCPKLKLLDISNNFLNGSIPSYFTQFLDLELLQLSYNKLTGTIPNFQQSTLTRLSLNNNLLTGAIPNFNLIKLESLALEFNNLSDTIPNLNLPNLKTLRLYNNLLRGSIPKLSLPKLEELTLSNNKLTGDIPDFSLPSLKMISLSINELTGNIPDWNIPNLIDIGLSVNRLTGCIPASFKKYCRYCVRLDGNIGLPNGGDFNAFLTNDLGNCANNICANPSANVKGGAGSITVSGITTSSAIIQIFNSAWTSVYNQQVTGNSVVIPISIVGAYNVKVTVLGAGGKWPSLCSNLVNNVTVTNGGNPCDTDNTPPVFTNCPQNISIETTDTAAIATWTAPSVTDNCTTTPSLSSNYNSGSKFSIGSKTVIYTATDAKVNRSTCSFIVSVAQKNNCRYSDSLALVDVFNSMGGSTWSITGKWDLLKPISEWAGIQLDSNGCVTILVPSDASGSISPSIGKLSQLKILYLNSGKITDTLPSSLGNLTKLRHFYSYGSTISGTIPSSFGNMVSMEELILESNKLTGTIPSSLGNLKKLKLLVLRHNQLTGAIPSSFANLSNIEYIELSDNLLSGSLPTMFENATVLRTLNLSINSFTDTIPKYLAALPNLSSLNLSKNQLSGCIPPVFKSLCGKDVNISGNIGLPNNGDWQAFCDYNTGTCTTPTNDLSISIGSPSSNYKQYTNVTINVAVSNTGTTPMSNIKIKFPYPAQTVNGGKATPSVGTWSDYCAGGVLCYEWNIPTLAANSTANLSIPLFILGATTPIVATATLATSTPVDNNTSNNLATLSLLPATTTQQLASPNRPKPSQFIPVVIQTIAPNPTEGDVLIDVESIVEKEVRFDFYNTLGKVVKTEWREVKKGLNHLNFDFWNAQNGIYFIQTNEGEGRGVPLKFVKM